MKVMKKFWFASAAATLLMAGSAAAADLAVAPVVAPVPYFGWTGFYFGANVGAGRYSTDWSNPFGPQVFGDAIDAGGWVAGGQLGFNYQLGSVVLGLEADASAADLDGTNTCLVGLNPLVGGVNCRAKVEAVGTIAGRLGLAFDRTLLYIKGGGAWTQDNYELNLVGVGGGTIYSANADHWGWTIGGGVEHALLANVTAKLEYNYLDFGSENVGFGLPPAFTVINNLSIDQQVHVFKLGVNYLFNGSAPLVANY
jgi:opacity protein-like surface antigen